MAGGAYSLTFVHGLHQSIRIGILLKTHIRTFIPHSSSLHFSPLGILADGIVLLSLSTPSSTIVMAEKGRPEVDDVSSDPSQQETGGRRESVALNIVENPLKASSARTPPIACETSMF